MWFAYGSADAVVIYCLFKTRMVYRYLAGYPEKEAIKHMSDGSIDEIEFT